MLHCELTVSVVFGFGQGTVIVFVCPIIAKAVSLSHWYERKEKKIVRK